MKLLERLARRFLEWRDFKVLTKQQWNTHANAMSVWAKRAAMSGR